MATLEEYRHRSRDHRLERLARTPDELSAAIDRRGDDVLSRRPDARNWSAKEVVCHLRDIEEVFMLRFHMMLGTDDPVFLVLGELPPEPERWGIGAPIGMPLDPGRWAEERQYLRHDTGTAIAGLRRRRRESLVLLGRLAPAEWRRGSVHVTLGPMTFDDWTSLMAAHDDTHLAQLLRALEGKP
jgi:DinB superfamily